MEKIPVFYFDMLKTGSWGKLLKDEFNSAQPFRHVVIDDFLPESVLELLVSEFPGSEDIEWDQVKMRKNTTTYNKITTANETKFGPFTRHFMSQLNSQTFLNNLRSLMDTTDIIVDPYYRGCGMHSTGPEGFVKIHTDRSRHISKDVDQLLNLILYLNPDWKEEYGGHLEFWDKKGKSCVKKILPVANRCVIFETGTSTFHGHPHPLNCPKNRRRNSLALYYYSSNRKISEEYEGWAKTETWLEHPS